MAGNQPYFLPYIGYFQLIADVDLFVLADNLQYSKGGWVNRNRMLQNGKDAMFTLPLNGDQGGVKTIGSCRLARDFDRTKILRRFEGGYAKAPCFRETFGLLEQIFDNPSGNLFEFVQASIRLVCDHLDIDTAFRNSSSLSVDHTLKGSDWVLAVCNAIGADRYINAIGGTGMYSREQFAMRGVELQFLRSRPYEYQQFGGAFVPWLSIVDVLMFNPRDLVSELVHSHYDLV